MSYRILNTVEGGAVVAEGLTYEEAIEFLKPDPELVLCDCTPHDTRPNDRFGGIYCDTEGQGYCNFECPHWEEE